MKTYKTTTYIIAAIILAAIYLTGYYIGRSDKVRGNEPEALRVHGDGYTSPLLLTDFSNSNTSVHLESTSSELEELVSSHKSSSSLESVSIFYRGLIEGEQISINLNAKYYPASLGKVPLLMAYYKKSETDPSILTTRGYIDFDHDYNEGQEIKPSKAPVSGKEYSVQELLTMMIKNSDNTGFHLLMGQPQAQSLLQQMYNDLKLTFPYAQTTIEDVVTVNEYSRFFRLLYNATYINEELSEQALELLSEVEYKNGIVAGLPNDVQVAHKFGLDTQRNTENNEIIGRQLHDCGIIYKSNDPYLLCIMTKSGAGELKEVEQVIAEISKFIYEKLPTK